MPSRKHRLHRKRIPYADEIVMHRTPDENTVTLDQFKRAWYEEHGDDSTTYEDALADCTIMRATVLHAREWNLIEERTEGIWKKAAVFRCLPGDLP